MSPLCPPLLLLLLTFFTPSLAALTNLTIDDSDLAYFTWTEDPGVAPVPTLPWAAISPTTPCLYCSAQPQTADIYQQTWHDGTNNSAGSFTFQGSAVYIYGIDLSNPANISFTLDGNAAPFHYYAGSEQFVFKSLFFSATALPPTVKHTVSWVLHATKTNGSTGLFDYAVITVDESTAAPSGTSASSQSSGTSPPSTQSRSKSKIGPFLGGLIGGVALIAAIGIAVVFLRRRRRRTPDAPLLQGEGEAPQTREASGQARPTDLQPFTEQAPSPLSATPGSEKMLDAAWMNPALSLPTTTSIPSTSTTDLSESSAPPSSAVPLSSTTRDTEREIVLEDRIAQLEAQVQQHIAQPPPYVAPPSP
ncbi:hypothetical protein B0H19DRAFT_1067690 [Mycena capillaripes]|nr:hypothetical protein B0H19DRAFT_1067690 [Mycena capillaripes]